MHKEKNVCDNLTGTILGVEGKTKYNLNAQLDLVELGIRKDLHLVVDEKRKANIALCTFYHVCTTKGDSFFYNSGHKDA